MRSAIRADRILRVEFTTADLARTQAFYAALGFVVLGTAPLDAAETALLGVPGSRAWRVAMRLGGQEVAFVAFDPPGRPYPAGSTATDLWFQHIAIAVADMDEAHRRALAAGAQPITQGGPQTLPPNTGGVTAWKFRDPDGHPLEFLLFPPGQGSATWQRRGGGAPCLGIDHTAVSVGETAAAEAFYAELGLSPGEISHNRGAEQERLDDVAGVAVEVVPLNLPHQPPHIELLGYAVGLRRPMPPGTRADDIWCSRIWMAGVAREAAAMEPAATLPGDRRRAWLSHDPDGHALVLLGEAPAAG